MDTTPDTPLRPNVDSDASVFLRSLASTSKISSSKQRIMLARKMNELKKLKGAMRGKQCRLKKLANELKTQDAQKAILIATINQLEAEIMNADFSAFDPEEGDYHGIKALLKQLFLNADVGLSDIADVLVKGSLTSVIKQVHDSSSEDSDSDTDEKKRKDNANSSSIKEVKDRDTGNKTVKEEEVAEDEDGDDDDDDSDDDPSVLGLIGVVPLSSTNTEGSRNASVRKYLISRCTSDSLSSKLKELLSKERVGLVLNERMVNFPAEIAAPTFETLQSEMEKSSVKYDHLILISKMLHLKTKTKTKGGPSSAKRARKAPPASDGFHLNREERFFVENATLKYSFSVAGEKDSSVMGSWSSDKQSYESHRHVSILSKENFAKSVRQILKAHTNGTL